MWLGILSIFGGTFFAMTDAGYQCISGYGCEDVWRAAAKLFLMPQVAMGEAIDTINQKTADGSITMADMNSNRNQIIASILTTAILFIFFTWVFTKTITTLNATDLMAAALLSLVTIAIMQVGLDWFTTGSINHWPFVGFMKLWANPGVLISTINYSEVLPLNQTLNMSGS